MYPGSIAISPDQKKNKKKRQSGTQTEKCIMCSRNICSQEHFKSSVSVSNPMKPAFFRLLPPSGSNGTPTLALMVPPLL